MLQQQYLRCFVSGPWIDLDLLSVLPWRLPPLALTEISADIPRPSRPTRADALAQGFPRLWLLTLWEPLLGVVQLSSYQRVAAHYRQAIHV